MSRYIDIEPIEKFGIGDCYTVSFELLKAQPTADVRENVHARWEIHNILDYAGRPTGRMVG